MGQLLKSPYLQALHEHLMTSCERARTLAMGLNPDQLNWKPGEDRWSIAQCLEHTLVGADRYGEKLAPAIERAQAKRLSTTGDVPPRHTILGHLILRAVEPTAKRKMSSPQVFAPAQSEISDKVVDTFIRSHEKISELLSDSDGLNLNKARLSSPVAKIIRINAADTFEILAAHAERHLNQAYRVRDLPAFPA